MVAHHAQTDPGYGVPSTGGSPMVLVAQTLLLMAGHGCTLGIQQPSV